MNARAIVFVAMMAPSLCAAGLATNYDRFKDRTETAAPSNDEVNRATLGGRLVVQASTFFSGTTPKAPPPFVGISFRSTSYDGWKYLRCHEVAALLDGQPIALPRSRHNGSPVSGKAVVESVLVLVPWEDFGKIAAASRVEFRVCRTELTVPDALLSDWRALIQANTPSADPPK